ncbi:hypothetical protein VKA52_14640 [Halobacillus sp. HZG1]|uniref:hypothetical protein n=1 Tax=Halobacillus sp. HZG1 TaxID=3111769 RepID=UPI002DB83FB5|nr:hypothetical protein [Halobacillus sp. HZG1]MEC3884971.1 hypothetical protein [Halobacillus sp. HZG1]
MILLETTPFDYSDKKFSVYFEVADKKSTLEVFKKIAFIDKIEHLQYGFKVNIARQQIPEIVRYLSQESIAIYAVTPQK